MMSKKAMVGVGAALLIVLGASAPVSAQVCAPLDDGRIADAFHEGTVIYWDPVVSFERITLTISGPCEDIVKVFGPKDEIMFDIRDIERVTDGQYTWSLQREAKIDPGVQENLQEARGSGEEDRLWWSYFQAGKIPGGPYSESGHFVVDRGQIVDPNSGEEEKVAVRTKTGARSSSLAGAASVGSFAAAGGGENGLSTKQTISGNLTVWNSLCVGFDCLANESYSFDTIRLKENNLRIHFDDTSTAGSYPNQDWRIEANSSANGGGEWLRFIDATAGRNIMTLEANAPSDSLVVDSGGRVGLGTANPVLELHVANGDSPGMRLEQTNASGFAPQTWDVVGNETSFFVRDATNGSTLPFRIRPGAASNVLVIDTDSQVGVGILTPTERFHVSESANVNTLLLVENNHGGNTAAGVLRAKSDTATVNFQSHGSGRTLMRFGEALGGWSEMLQIAGDGLIIGTIGNDPLILGTDSNNVLEITAAGDVLYQGVAVHSDYVFEPDYELPSIDEQVDYMWSNKHLPAIGPARVTEDGREVMELGSDRQAIVEELEKAHIYIGQLHALLKQQSEEFQQRFERLEAELAEE